MKHWVTNITGFKIIFSVCDAAFSNASPTVASIQPVTTTRATYVNRYSCVDQSPLCQPSLCSKWSSAQTQCRKTCHPDCKVYTTKAKPIRTTRPPRVKTTRPPKVAKLGFYIRKNSFWLSANQITFRKRSWIINLKTFIRESSNNLHVKITKCMAHI